MRPAFLLLTVLFLAMLGVACGGSSAGEPVVGDEGGGEEEVPAPPPTSCGPLPTPTGPTATVDTVQGLVSAMQQANAGTGPKTILVAEGTYTLGQLLHVTAPGIMVRGASGDRDAVILRGAGMQGGVSHVFLVAASRFTAAHLTVKDVANHAIQVQGELDVDDVTFHDVRFQDTGEQMLKISYRAGSDVGSDRGTVSCCLFEYTAGIGPQYYIGGVDGHQCTGWVVRHSTFRGIRSPETALAEHAIHFWSDSKDTVVEGCLIDACDRGIGFGLGSRGHQGGVIRNNMVRSTRDVGIGLETASGVTVLHNTVFADGYPNAIEVRFAASTATVVGNLTVGAIAERNGGTATASHNLRAAPEEALFVDAPNGDLHLRAAAPAVVDQVPVRADAPQDLDGDARPQGTASDIGADEWTGD